MCLSCLRTGAWWPIQCSLITFIKFSRSLRHVIVSGPPPLWFVWWDYFLVDILGDKIFACDFDTPHTQEASTKVVLAGGQGRDISTRRLRHRLWMDWPIIGSNLCAQQVICQFVRTCVTICYAKDLLGKRFEEWREETIVFQNTGDFAWFFKWKVKNNARSYEFKIDVTKIEFIKNYCLLFRCVYTNANTHVAAVTLNPHSI